MIYNSLLQEYFQKISRINNINRSNRKGLQMIEKYNIVTIGSLPFIVPEELLEGQFSCLPNQKY